MFTLVFEINDYFILGATCLGGDDCCSSSNQCAIDMGDCDGPETCKGNLKCGHDNCHFQSGDDWDKTDDCCYDHIVMRNECFRDFMIMQS